MQVNVENNLISENMKVCYITMVFPSPSETFICNEVSFLCRTGVKVSVKSLLPARSDALKILKQRGIENLDVEHGSLQNSLIGLLISLKNPVLLLEIIFWICLKTWQKPVHLVKSLILLPRIFHIFFQFKQKPPDILHLYWGHYPSILAYLVQRQIPSISVSMFLASYDLVMNYGCSDPVARNADLVATFAKADIATIEKLGVSSNRTFVHYQGVKLEYIINNQKINKVKHQIISAGRLIKEKAMDDVIRIFHKVYLCYPDASLIILGDGPERKRLEFLVKSLNIEQSVQFLGHVEHSQVFEYLLQAEIFLFMSYYDGERLPNVIKEAMACRCLCIVSETPGIEELLCDKKHGYVVSQRDVDAGVRIIQRIFSEESGLSREKMIEDTYSWVYDNFNLDNTMRKLLNKWEEILCVKKNNHNC